MFYNDEINWNDLKVGESYQYEEKYYFQAIVTVTENNTDNEYFSFTVRIKEVVGGTMVSGWKTGDTFRVSHSKDERYDYLRQSKFKELGSLYDYTTEKKEGSKCQQKNGFRIEQF
jgi:hypothetical protein